MRKSIIIIFIILIWSLANASDDNDYLQRENELKEIGLSLRDAILHKDVRKFLEYVSDDGIPCNDTVIPYNKITEDLENPNSWLYCYLFSSQSFERKYKDNQYPIGLERFFKEASNMRIEVSFMEVKGKKRSDYGCVHYKTVNRKYVPELCFFYKNNKWTFTDSLYSCN